MYEMRSAGDVQVARVAEEEVVVEVYMWLRKWVLR